MGSTASFFCAKNRARLSCWLDSPRRCHDMNDAHTLVSPHFDATDVPLAQSGTDHLYRPVHVAPLAQNAHKAMRKIAAGDGADAGRRSAWAPPQLAAVGAGFAGLASSDSDLRAMFESSSLLLCASAGELSPDHSSVVFACLCAYLCHSSIWQGPLEEELCELFIVRVLRSLLLLSREPLAERVACDLFGVWARRSSRASRSHLGALALELLRSLIATPPSDDIADAGTALTSPGATRTTIARRAAQRAAGRSDAEGCAAANVPEAQALPGGDAEVPHIFLSTAGVVSCVRELVEALATCGAPRDASTTLREAGDGDADDGLWRQLLHESLAAVRRGRDSEATRAVINTLLPSFFSRVGLVGEAGEQVLLCVRAMLGTAPQSAEEAAAAAAAAAAADADVHQMGAGSVKSARRVAARGEATVLARRMVGWQLLSRLPLVVFSRLSVDGDANVDERDWLMEALRTAVCDPSSTVRKRAMYILGLAAAPTSDGLGLRWDHLARAVGWQREQWHVYLAMLDAVENSSPHYIVELWPKLPSLLPSDRSAADRPDESTTDAATAAAQAAAQMLWLERLFLQCLSHRSHVLRLRTLHTLASTQLQGARLSAAFVGDLVIAMDDPQLLRVCGLNATNGVAPLGALAHWGDIQWSTVCRPDFGAELRDKGGVESSDGRGASWEVEGVQAFALILLRFLLQRPPLPPRMGGEAGMSVAASLRYGAGSRCTPVAELLAVTRLKTAAPRTAVLVMASLALAAEYLAQEPKTRVGPTCAQGVAARDAGQGCAGGGSLGEEEAAGKQESDRGCDKLELSAEALSHAVGVVGMVDRSCRHTPLQHTLHSSLLRLLASSYSCPSRVSEETVASGATAGGKATLKNILALLACIPEAELNSRETSQQLRAWLLGWDGRGAGEAGEDDGGWISRQVLEHAREYLLIAAPGGGAGRTEPWPDESELEGLHAKACGLARVMALTVQPGAARRGRGADSVWGLVESRLSRICTHAYLPWSAAERAVMLLKHVLMTVRRARSSADAQLLAEVIALCAGPAGVDVVSYALEEVAKVMASASAGSAGAGAMAQSARVNLMMEVLEEVASVSARAVVEARAAEGRVEEGVAAVGAETVGQHRASSGAISLLQLSGLRHTLRSAGESLHAHAARLDAEGPANSGVAAALALRVVRGLAGPLLTDVRHLGAALPGSRVRNLALRVRMLSLGERPAGVPPREWRGVATAFSSERLLAMDAILDACTLHVTPTLTLGHEHAAAAAAADGCRPTEESWMLPLADSDEATAVSWRSLRREALGGAAGGGDAEQQFRDVARQLTEAVLEAADSAVQDGHALPLLQCLMRLLPDAVLSDARGAFPSTDGGGVLGEEEVDEALLERVWVAAEAVAGQFLEEGRIKGFYAGGDWPQLAQSMMLAYLRVVFHPRLWAVGALQGAHGALLRRWAACWDKYQDAPRFVKLFATYSCVLWRRFPQSIRGYEGHLALLAIYGTPPPSDSVAGTPLDTHTVAGALAELGAGGVGGEDDALDMDRHRLLLEGKETFVRVLVTFMLVRVHHDCCGRDLQERREAAAGAGAGTEGVHVAAVEEVMLRVMEELLALSRSGELNSSSYLPYSLIHRRKNRLWQAAAIVAGLLPGRCRGAASDVAARLEAVVVGVFEQLRKDERRSVRHYVESVAFRLVRGDARRVREHVGALLHEFDCAVPVAASAMLLANFVLRYHHGTLCDGVREDGMARGQGRGTGDGEQAMGEALEGLAVAVLPWFSHHTHHVRALASLALKVYHSCSDAVAGCVASGGKPEGAERVLTEAAVKFMRENEEVAKLHSHLEGLFFSGLDLETLCDHATVLAPVAGVAVDAAGEQMPAGLVQRLEQEMNDCHRALLAVTAAAAAPGEGNGLEREGAQGVVANQGVVVNDVVDVLVQRKYLPDHVAAHGGCAAGVGWLEDVVTRVGGQGKGGGESGARRKWSWWQH